jgi:putative DNA primase/helicase
MDKLGGFLDDCCVLDVNAKAQAGDLYQAYKNWCEVGGEKYVGRRRFSEQMAERGFDKGRDNKGIVYYGVGLLAHNEEESV